jgi:FO synthase
MPLHSTTLARATAPSRTPATPRPDDILAAAVAGEALDFGAYCALIDLPREATPALLAAAARLRDRGKGKSVTFSPKVFLPITNLCRDRCSYCTFRKDPRDPDAWTMTRAEIRRTVRAGRARGCAEALMCLGDRPERAFRQYRTTLARLGHESTVGYVREACEIALEEGLLPHTNMGVLTRDEMARLRPVNASLGLMLENVSPRLRERGMPHHHAPDKDPAVRLRMIEEAGELGIPFTTGILIGIGETTGERVASLLAIRDVHRRHGHIQEVIIQNFRAKPNTPMHAAGEPEALDVARTVAVARLVLGPAMSVQAPPNLSPDDHRLLLQAGINDWGGISPVTKDFVNPEAPWPHLAALARTCAAAGFALRPRLCVYPGYVSDRWVDPRLLGAVGLAASRLRSEWPGGPSTAAAAGEAVSSAVGQRPVKHGFPKDEHAAAL